MNATELDMPTDEIDIVVNGAALRLRRGSSIAELVAERGLEGRRFAVELDGAIVPRSRHAATLVAPGNRIEIVVAVGGG